MTVYDSFRVKLNEVDNASATSTALLNYKCKRTRTSSIQHQSSDQSIHWLPSPKSLMTTVAQVTTPTLACITVNNEREVQRRSWSCCCCHLSFGTGVAQRDHMKSHWQYVTEGCELWSWADKDTASIISNGVLLYYHPYPSRFITRKSRPHQSLLR